MSSPLKSSPQPESTPARATSAHLQEAIAQLRAELGEKVLTDPEDLAVRSRDRSHHQGTPPAAAVVPLTTEDVATAVRICATYGVPVVPRGAGTGLEGGANTHSGSISLDVRGMRQVRHIAPADMYATVEAGVMKSELNQAASSYGLHCPVGPGVDASVGGMAATSASGTTAVSRGTVAENVIGLTAVLGDGSVIRTGGTTRKTSAGYDLTHLLVGSEGTLGVITEVTIRLHPIPETTTMGIWTLPALGTAAELVVEAIQAGLQLERVELLDEATVSALVAYRDFAAPVAPTVMVEFAGQHDGVTAQYARFAQLAAAAGGVEHARSSDPAESEALWQIRHDALPAAVALVPGASAITTDVCVPISHLAQCIRETQADVQRLGLVAPIVGHVGDGNFHVAIVLAADDTDGARRAQELNESMVARALKAGGTCTGEHGIGSGKIGFLAAEHASALPAMRAVKKALDPQGILNPGKVLAADE